MLSFRLWKTRRNALSPQSDPLCEGLHLTFGSLEHDIGHRLHIRHGDFTSTQPADKAQHGWPGSCAAVHGRANFGSDHTAQIGRTEREVAIDDADGLEAFQRFRNLRTGEGPEPAQADEADFLALFAHLADGN